MLVPVDLASLPPASERIGARVRGQGLARTLCHRESAQQTLAHRDRRRKVGQSSTGVISIFTPQSIAFSVLGETLDVSEEAGDYLVGRDKPPYSTLAFLNFYE